MSILTRLAKIERQLDQYVHAPQVHFFDSEKECEEARENGLVRENDICLIDDVQE